MKTKSIILVAILFVIYLAVLIKLLIFKYPSAMTFQIANGNYIPFKTILNYLNGGPIWTVAIRNIVGNIILFFPFGFFLPFFRHSINWKFVLISAFIISAAIEITQGIFQVGVVDVDDIILNVLGVVAGYGVFLWVTSLPPINTRLNRN